MAKTVQMSDLRNKSEYHSDVTMAYDKDNMTHNYVSTISFTTSMHIKTNKLVCWKPRYGKKHFWIVEKEKKGARLVS